MSRRSILALVGAALIGTLALAGCASLVRVETGEIVTCTYGEVTTDTVHAIEVPADQAANYTVTRTTVICDRHKQIEALYEQAQAAILASNLEDAKAKLAEIVALDAAFKHARTQLDAINAGKKPVVDSGTTKPSTDATSGPGGQLPVGPVANLTDYVPDSLPGYTAEPVIADVFNLTREYIANDPKTVDYLTVVVEQYKTADAAQKQLTQMIAPGYSFDVSKVTVSGKDLRFGTDGKRFATMAWTQGSVLVVIEASSAVRRPVELKSHLTTLAGSIVK